MLFELPGAAIGCGRVRTVCGDPAHRTSIEDQWHWWNQQHNGRENCRGLHHEGLVENRPDAANVFDGQMQKQEEGGRDPWNIQELSDWNFLEAARDWTLGSG